MTTFTDTASFTNIDNTVVADGSVAVDAMLRVLGGTPIAGSSGAEHLPPSAYDSDPNTYWLSQTSGVAWLGYDYGAPTTIKKYAVTASANAMPVAWQIEAYNDESYADFAILQSTSEETPFAEGERREYSLTVTGAYRFYRLRDITGGVYKRIIELEWLVDGVAEFLINDSGALVCDAGAGRAWVFSEAAETLTGSPTLEYQYAGYTAAQGWSTAAEVDDNAAWSGSWLSLAELQAVGDTGYRFIYLKARLGGDSDESLDAFATGTYQLDLSPPTDVSAIADIALSNSGAYDLVATFTGGVDADGNYAGANLEIEIDGVSYFQQSDGSFSTSEANLLLSGSEGARGIVSALDRSFLPTRYRLNSWDSLGNYARGDWGTFDQLDIDSPTPPALAVGDNGDGTANFTVSGSDAGSVNRIYAKPVGTLDWVLKTSVAGDGSASAALDAGWTWCKVETEVSGQTVCGAVTDFWMGGETAAGGEQLRQAWRASLASFSPLTALLGSADRIRMEYSDAPAKAPAVLLDFAWKRLDGSGAPGAYEFEIRHLIVANSHTELDRISARIDEAVRTIPLAPPDWQCSSPLEVAGENRAPDLRYAFARVVTYRLRAVRSAAAASVTFAAGEEVLTLSAPRLDGAEVYSRLQAVGNTLGGGVYVYDSGLEQTRRTEPFRNLTDAQKTALAEFFHNRDGQAQSFTYTDSDDATYSGNFASSCLSFIKRESDCWDVDVELKLEAAE